MSAGVNGQALGRRVRAGWDATGRRLGQLRDMASRYGPVYAGLSGLQRFTEDRLLAIEGRLGVLGPAHARHAGNSTAANREVWSDWDWTARGEEWSDSPEWKSALIAQVLEPHMPKGGVLLEVGPGAGRWSEALHARAERLVLVDVSEHTLELCRMLFGDEKAEYVHSPDGASLPGVQAASIDGIWSFDAFVHIAPLDVAAYLTEFARVLRPGAAAVVHHAGRREPRAWRAPMSARLFANLAADRGLEVERQLDSWEGGRFSLPPYGDVITVLRARS